MDAQTLCMNFASELLVLLFGANNLIVRCSVPVGWATERHFKSDNAWSTSSLHTCLLSVGTFCDFRAVVWNNSLQKKQNLKMIHFRFRVSRHYF